MALCITKDVPLFFTLPREIRNLILENAYLCPSPQPHVIEITVLRPNEALFSPTTWWLECKHANTSFTFHDLTVNKQYYNEALENIFVRTPLWLYGKFRECLPRIINQSPTIQRSLRLVLIDVEIDDYDLGLHLSDLGMLAKCSALRTVTVGIGGWVKKLSDCGLKERLAYLNENLQPLKNVKSITVVARDERIQALLANWEINASQPA